MITFSGLQWLCEKLDQSLSGLGSCFPSREERLAEAEQQAWDMYVAGVLADTNATRDLAVVTADYVLN